MTNESKEIPKKKPTKIADPQSFLQELRKDWTMFWHAFVGEAESISEAINSNEMTVPQPLTLEKVKELTKSLSQNRKKLNQQLEKIKKEIDESTSRVETLNLVGGSIHETIDRIAELNKLGQKTNHELTVVNEKIKKARRIESQLKKLEIY